MRARSLITRPTGNPLGNIVILDLLDLHVLNTLLADRSLHTQVSWRSFERLLAAVLERFGYEIELSRGTKDGGIDILALKRQTDFGPHRYLVQAKRWSGKIGVEPIRELLFLREHLGATKACLATTSSFTAGAWKLGEEYQWALELRDYDRLCDWIHVAFPFLPSW
jgi:HJR/Mrr/RecB family endonuclease